MSDNTVHFDEVPTERTDLFATHEYTARDADGYYIGRFNPRRGEGALYMTSAADVITRFTDLAAWMESVNNYR